MTIPYQDYYQLSIGNTKGNSKGVTIEDYLQEKERSNTVSINSLY